MPIPSDLFAVIDENINRLAMESVIAQVGRDDGLVPAYSLLGEMREQLSLAPALREPVSTVHTALERLLDGAQPFDAATLGLLRSLVDWLPGAVELAKRGQPVGEMGAAGAADRPAGKPTPEAEEKGATGDLLLELHLEDNRELLTEFLGEAMDHLQQIEAALLALDHEPENPEALNSIFRSFHTIKGNAGFLGLVPMQTLAHEVESLLDLARNHKLRLNAAIITEILHSRDALSALTQQVAAAIERGVLPDRVVPVSHLIRAVRALAALPTTGAATTVAAPAPVAKAAAPAEAPAAPVLAFTPTAAEAAGSETCPPVAVKPVATPPVAQGSAAEAASAGKSGGSNQTVRVNTEKLDSLMDVVGELVIVQSQLLETTRTMATGHTMLQRNVSQLSRITKELQHTAMSLRMIPIKATFQKMERLSRDLARDFGKKVEFATSGEDTELDRTVVEQIGDPLVHMVRNALDHGLEPAADRLARGKPEAGSLHLNAYHQGSNIVIELRDDGRGIDPDKVLAKARKQGLVAENATLSREECFNLLFLPGFSTAEKVTSVSGRGVGMDVVRRNIDKLRGRIEISSEVGQGSTFRIKLPLTMAIIDGLVVRVGQDRFILPSTSVQMALRPTRESVSTVHGSGEIIDIRGRLMPLHRLHRRFGIPANANEPWEGIVVIVEHSGRASALLVDEMVSKQEVVIKNLGNFMQNLPGVAGGAILGDGNIALILDPGTLLQAA
jgi:two-component system chemotaxis sensor kinase CheA